MIELPAGSRFYLDDKLIEVAEGEGRCSSCVFYKRPFNSRGCDEDFLCCYTVNCSSIERKDKKCVTFREVSNG